MREKELEDKLEKNLNKVELGLRLIERQKRVETGIIDMFCRDKKGNYVIIEIKTKADPRDVAQLARYKMALIKKGISKKRLRMILVVQKMAKHVKETCKFFRVEIKNVYKERIIGKKEAKKSLDNKSLNIFTGEGLIDFIKRRKLVNFSMIARHFKINNATVSDLIEHMEYNDLVSVKQIGSSKIVMVKKR